MGGSAVELSYVEVAIAAALILVNAAISAALRLGLGRELLVASARTVVQLLLVGLVLQRVFAIGNLPLIALLLLLMTAVAARAATRRARERYRGMALDAFLGMLVGSWAMTAVALTTIVRAEPWYAAQYSVPVLGMILGNALNGVSLGLDRLTTDLARRHEIESLLALGATSWEAARETVGEAVRTGMIPTINTMMVVGIVSLPGMMTGQILAGANPMQAVRYQIVILFLIAAATALGTVGVVLLGYRRLFNSDHQLRQVGGRATDTGS